MQVGSNPFLPLSAFCNFQQNLRKLFWRVFCWRDVAMAAEWLHNVKRKATERHQKGNRNATERQQNPTARQQKGCRKHAETSPSIFCQKLQKTERVKKGFGPSANCSFGIHCIHKWTSFLVLCPGWL